MTLAGRLLGSMGLLTLLAGASAVLWLPMTASLASFTPEPSGALGFSPATGIDWTPLSVVSSGTCSDPRGSNLQLMVSGHGFPGRTNVTPNLRASIYPVDPTTGGYDVPLQDSLHNFAAQQNPPAVLTGRYDFTLVCKKPWGFGTFGTYVGSLLFSTPTHYRALTSAPEVTRPPVSPQPQVTRSAPDRKPPSPASTSGHSRTTVRVTSAAPLVVSPGATRQALSLSTPATKTAQRLQPTRVRDIPATSAAVAGQTAAPANTPSLQRVPSDLPAAGPRIATDPQSAGGGSRTALLAAVAGTLLVVLALGLVLRRRLGHRGPT